MDLYRRNKINVSGQGEAPMLFAHGFGCDQSMWRYVAPEFAADFRTVVFDHVGSGGSDIAAYEESKYSTLHGYAADIVEICDFLGLRDVVFVGHSVSATMGMLAAIRRPELFRALVLVGPSPCLLNDGDYHGGFTREDIDELLLFLDSNYVGWSKTMSKVIMGNPERPELGEELETLFCQSDPEIAKKFARVTFLADHRADLPKVPTRSLILQCQQDPIAPVAVGEYMHAQMRDSELKILRATGHCPNLSAPAEVVEAMRRFLEPPGKP
jgi:sigma-B regulation protein RsbQ